MLTAPEIYLCYAKEDENSVKQFHSFLKKQGCRPWMATEDLLPGKNWRLEIPKVIKRSSFVMIFFSTTSVEKRGYVQKEFNLALEEMEEMPEGELFIIPIRLDNCQIPSRFADIQYVDLFAPNGKDKILKAIWKDQPRTDFGGDVQTSIERPRSRPLRDRALSELPEAAVRRMLIQHNFPARAFKWNEDYSHPHGAGFDNDYEADLSGQIILDHHSQLIWQRSGSDRKMKLADVPRFLSELNADRFGGYTGWRLPTLEEAMTLVEPDKKSGTLYIVPLFDQRQWWLWTADRLNTNSHWCVNLKAGYCGLKRSLDSQFVRAVCKR